MYLITSKDLHYLINQVLIDRDGIAWYKAIVEHVHGTTNTDIRKAKYALESLEVYDSKNLHRIRCFLTVNQVFVNRHTMLFNCQSGIV
jgi:hypothetical protein